MKIVYILVGCVIFTTAAMAGESTFEKAFTPKEAHRLWVQYGQAKNLEGLLSLYETDGSIYDIGNGKTLTTPEERRVFLTEFLATVAQFELSTASVTTNGRGDVALLRSRWDATGVSEDEAGERSEWTSKNCGSEVVRKQADGSWLFIVDNPYAADDWEACPVY